MLRFVLRSVGSPRRSPFWSDSACLVFPPFPPVSYFPLLPLASKPPSTGGAALARAEPWRTKITTTSTWGSISPSSFLPSLLLVSPGHAKVSGALLGFSSTGIISVNPCSASTERTFSLGLFGRLGLISRCSWGYGGRARRSGFRVESWAVLLEFIRIGFRQ